MYKQLTISDRIIGLEEELGLTVPGTQLCRVLSKNSPLVEWCLALGRMWEPKRFFYGLTIEECLNAAENAIMPVEEWGEE